MDKTIKRLFGSKPPIQGALGPAIAIIQGLSQYDWEAAWPGIQKAMIGLGAAAIVTLKGEAIAKGIPRLAERIASFGGTIDISGNVQDQSRSAFGDAFPTSIPSLPYIPLIPIRKQAELAQARSIPQGWEKELGYEITDTMAPKGKPDLVWVMLNEGGFLAGQGLMWDDFGVESIEGLSEQEARRRGTLMDRAPCLAKWGVPDEVTPGPMGYPIYTYY